MRKWIILYDSWNPETNEFTQDIWHCEAEDMLHAINQLLDSERTSSLRVACIQKADPVFDPELN